MTKTQTSDILQHLKDGRRLTQKEAINEYGAYRLSSIIHSLRKKGYRIESKQLDVPTRYKKTDGTTRNANIVEYKMIKDDKKSFDSRLKNFMESILQ
tara:strand:+ start:3172 stop:3462 length:291 start_codon:yes stop_codon:yes gene_type:complete